MGTPMTTSGMTDAQINRACEIFRGKLTKHASELPSDAVQQVFGDSSLPKEWLASLRTRVEAVSELIVSGRVAKDTYTVSIDYHQSLADMIAAGRYDWKNDDITSRNFPVKGDGQVTVDVTLVHYDRVMSRGAVLKNLDERGYRPATIEELLALGSTKPDLQREFPIIGLGSVWLRPNGYRYCPCLDRGGSGRDLGLYWFEDGFSEICRFAAVRK